MCREAISLRPKVKGMKSGLSRDKVINVTQTLSACLVRGDEMAVSKRTSGGNNRILDKQ